MGCGSSRIGVSEVDIQPRPPDAKRKCEKPNEYRMEVIKTTKLPENNNHINNGQAHIKNGHSVSNGHPNANGHLIVTEDSGVGNSMLRVESMASLDPPSPTKSPKKTPGHVSLASYSSTSTTCSFKRRKSHLMNMLDTSVFIVADSRALEAPPSLRANPQELVNYLVEPFKHSTLLQVRVIWRWITDNIVYDVESYFAPGSKKYGKSEAGEVLMSGKAVCSGYANVMKTLAEHTDIKVGHVVGWSKGYSYKIGMSFNEKETNHAWNSVEIDSEWWLLDATWASGYVDEEHKFVKCYNDHYFLTDPNVFIYDHFPQDPNWQLLDQWFAIEDFQSWAQFTKRFFYLKMKPITHKLGIIHTSKGKIHAKFRLDSDTPVICNGRLKDENTGTETDKYLHIYSTEKMLHVLINFPSKGDYELRLYARAEMDEFEELGMVCQYKVICDRETDECPVFPKQYKKWCKGFYLHEPRQGILYIGRSYKFRISLPGVTEMAVCLGGDHSSWEHIDLEGKDIWCGDVMMQPGTERVNVVAKFPNQTNSTYSSVLEWKVLPSESESRTS